ncbi:MFS transporter [Pseudoxanthomonas kalamensis DSM 18571]|uniref:MFS transporter n=1 Tax=Pseudoxanthomonas kalamensis TaxID=289483 RepID=UPI001390B9DF|nr:MFS transporter [Pseudoxanthomonas kalamensis]KAF1710437.1 MFS transporter [Pseudoxanthomonas kalamensis DSM 18571]
MSEPDPAADDHEGRTAPLRNRNFRMLLGYRLLSILSYQTVAVTVGWHVYELTRDPWMLGLIGLTEVLPYFCVAPFAGYLVDHLPRRKLGAAACIGLAITPLLLMSVALQWPFRSGIGAIYTAIALTGCVRAFLGPVYHALFARALPRRQFVAGASLGSIAFQMAMVVGPALGGMLIAVGGKPLAYGVATSFALIAVALLSRMGVTEPAPVLQRTPIFAGIAEGARFVLGHQVLLSALALDMFAVLFGGAISLAPAFIRDILHAGPEALGLLRASPALGAVLVGVWLARHPLQRDAGRTLLLAVAGFGLCMIGFGLSRWLWLSALILLLSGICDGISMVIRSTIMQLSTPDEMRGRVSSINGLFVGSSNEIGAFYAGSMARLLGLVPAVVLGGFATLGVVATTAWKAPRLRRLDLRELH